MVVGLLLLLAASVYCSYRPPAKDKSRRRGKEHLRTYAMLSLSKRPTQLLPISVPTIYTRTSPSTAAVPAPVGASVADGVLNK